MSLLTNISGIPEPGRAHGSGHNSSNSMSQIIISLSSRVGRVFVLRIIYLKANNRNACPSSISGGIKIMLMGEVPKSHAARSPTSNANHAIYLDSASACFWMSCSAPRCVVLPVSCCFWYSAWAAVLPVIPATAPPTVPETRSAMPEPRSESCPLASCCWPSRFWLRPWLFRDCIGGRRCQYE